ncbi:MAG: alpha/beta fold hydrolase [Bdellovibrionales bacterium]
MLIFVFQIFIVIGLLAGGYYGYLYLQSYLMYKRLERENLAAAHSDIWEDEDLEVEGHTEVGQHQIFSKALGRGSSTLVFFHGISASHYTWRLVLPLLKKNFRLLVVDLPGFGQSSKIKNYSYNLDDQTELMHRFLRTYGVVKPILVGSSMGGNIALWMARQYPEEYQDLVVISPAVEPGIGKLLNLRPLRFFARPLSFVADRAFVERMLNLVVADKSIVTEEVIDAYFEPYSRNHLAVKSLIKAFDAVKDRRLPKRLKYLRAKTLILWGEKDKLTSIKAAPRLNSILPHSNLEVNELAGHHIMEDDPHWVADMIQLYFKNT